MISIITKKINFLGKIYLLTLIGIMLFFTACSQGNVSSKTSTDTQKMDKLIFCDCGWDSNKLHNEIVSIILQEGYGYETDVTPASSPIAMKSLAKGDIDICMEAWTDNYMDVYKPGIDSGDIVELSVNFDDNAQGLYVPTYMIKGDEKREIEPMTPDLKSIKDLPKYWEVFEDPDDPSNGRIYGAPASWGADEILREKIKTYKLDETFIYFSPGSDTALATSIEGAVKKAEPWVGYYWDPTWIMGKYDMTLLEDEPYSDEKWDNGYACEFPGVKVTVAVNKEVAERAPEITDFLKNYKTTTKLNSELLAYMQDNNAEIEETAQWFMKEYEDMWISWVPEDVAEKVKESLN